MSGYELFPDLRRAERWYAGWSVIPVGEAEEVTASAEIEWLQDFGLEPVPRPRYHASGSTAAIAAWAAATRAMGRRNGEQLT